MVIGKENMVNEGAYKKFDLWKESIELVVLGCSIKKQKVKSISNYSRLTIY